MINYIAKTGKNFGFVLGFLFLGCIGESDPLRCGGTATDTPNGKITDTGNCIEIASITIKKGKVIDFAGLADSTNNNIIAARSNADSNTIYFDNAAAMVASPSADAADIIQFHFMPMSETGLSFDEAVPLDSIKDKITFYDSSNSQITSGQFYPINFASIVQNTEGKRVSGITLNIFNQISVPAFTGNTPPQFSDVSDVNGVVSIDSIKPGDYMISGVDSNENIVVMQKLIIDSNSEGTLATLETKAVQDFSGQLVRQSGLSSSGSVVYIKGTAMYANLDSAGNFSFDKKLPSNTSEFLGDFGFSLNPALIPNPLLPLPGSGATLADSVKAGYCQLKASAEVVNTSSNPAKWEIQDVESCTK